MTKANKFPEWLPTYIYTRSVHLIENVDLNSAEPLLLRLVTNDKMKDVWKTLSKKASDQKSLIDLLEFIRLHPALEGKSNDAINIPSDNAQRIVFNNIDKLVKQLIDELKELSSTREANDGWKMLESTLNRAELGHLKQHNEEFSKFFEIKQIQNGLESIKQDHSVTEILEVISLAAQYACLAPEALLPVRRNTSRAKYNWLILDLKRYLKKHFNTQSPIMIANIVNVSFDLSHDSVKEDDVRKLKE